MILLSASTNDLILQYLSVAISFIALIISFLGFIYIIKEYKINEEENVSRKAPIFLFESIKFQISNDKFPQYYISPQNSEFILERRSFDIKKEDEVWLNEQGICLLIDACPHNSKSDKTELINMNKINIVNIGFDAVYVEIKKITIYRNNGEPIIVSPSLQNKIFRRITLDNPLELYVSVIYNSESGIYDDIKIKSMQFLAEKLEEIDGEILNARLNVSADLWTEIVIEIITKNSFNSYYSQSLIQKIENNTYLADQTEPKLVKKEKSKIM